MNREGHGVARCTVERLMRAEGLRGISREKTRKTTTSEGAETERPADLVERQFVANAPNQLWVADLTYIRTHSGWTYAAFIIDVFSRLVVGWQASTSLRTDPALDALEMGFWNRQRAGQDVAGLTHHSERGVQYRAIRYTERLAEAKAVASVGSKGDSYDNAMAGAFNSLFKPSASGTPSCDPTAAGSRWPTSRSPSPNTLTGSTTAGSTDEIGLIPPAEFETNHRGRQTAEPYRPTSVPVGVGSK
jgi:putative transposase